MKNAVRALILMLCCFLLFGCGKKDTIYHRSYIEQHGGTFFLEFAYMKENSYGKEEPLRILRLQEGQNQDYEVLYSISSNDYKEGDLILMTDTYFYIFNQKEKKKNRIVSYSLDRKKKSVKMITNKEIPSIVTVHGIQNSDLYISYKESNNIKYLKISVDLKKIVSIKETDIPKKMDYSI